MANPAAISTAPGAAQTASAPLAAAARTQWRAIDATLAAIIGPRGIAALYQRSLALASVHHPWLAEALPASSTADPYEALQRSLSRRPAVQADAAAMQLLTDFKGLLASFVGSALADRLLIEVWPLPPSGAAAQDNEA